MVRTFNSNNWDTVFADYEKIARLIEIPVSENNTTLYYTDWLADLDFDGNTYSKFDIVSGSVPNVLGSLTRGFQLTIGIHDDGFQKHVEDTNGLRDRELTVRIVTPDHLGSNDPIITERFRLRKVRLQLSKGRAQLNIDGKLSFFSEWLTEPINRSTDCFQFIPENKVKMYRHVVNQPTTEKTGDPDAGGGGGYG